MTTDEMRERAARLRDRVDRDYPDAWDFRELPALVGVVESFARVETAYGARVVATVREVESDKRWAVWLSQAALFNRFRDLDVREGELVAIRYLGEGEPTAPGRNAPLRFRVEVDREGVTFDWEDVGNAHEDAPRARREVAPEDHAAHEAAMQRYAPTPTDDDIPF